MNDAAITIVLPVYGRSELLEPALSSVLAQTSPNWHLLIADDGSDSVTQGFLERWMEEHADPRLRWVRRPQNLGLFANLNQAIEDADTEWVVLLCSDDLLLAWAVQEVEKLRNQWPEAGLILSTFESINADGSNRLADSAWHHDQVSRETGLVTPEIFIPALLRLGSLNGNLTGMAFSRALWQKAGPFRSDWSHAADWEWLVRATEADSVLLNRTPIAQVRTHDMQLSNSNRNNGQELIEVSGVVQKLLRHPLLAEEVAKTEWAQHVMQFQLANLIRGRTSDQPRKVIDAFKLIQRTTGLRRTSLALGRRLAKKVNQIAPWARKSSSSEDRELYSLDKAGRRRERRTKMRKSSDAKGTE